MAARLVWLPRSEADLRDLLAYIKVDNSPAAMRFASDLVDRVELLAEFPEMGAVIPNLHDPQMREMGYRNYRIIYRYSAAKAKVEIVRIWHAARGEPPLP